MILATAAKKGSKKDESCTKEYCERLAKELSSVKDLPAGCQKYPTVVQTLESKEKAAENPFMGMWTSHQGAYRTCAWTRIARPNPTAFDAHGGTQIFQQAKVKTLGLCACGTACWIQCQKGNMVSIE